jgi:hypothetical protein
MMIVATARGERRRSITTTFAPHGIIWLRRKDQAFAGTAFAERPPPPVVMCASNHA